MREPEELAEALLQREEADVGVGVTFEAGVAAGLEGEGALNFTLIL